MTNNTTTTTENTAKHIIEVIPKTLPNINLIPTIANKINNIINTLTTKMNVGMRTYQQLYSKAMQTT